MPRRPRNRSCGYDLAAGPATWRTCAPRSGIDTWTINRTATQDRWGSSRPAVPGRSPRRWSSDSRSLPSPDFLTIGSRDARPCDLSARHERALPADMRQVVSGPRRDVRNAVARLRREADGAGCDSTVDAIRLGHPIRVLVDGAALVRLPGSSRDKCRGRGARGLMTIRDVLDGKLTGATASSVRSHRTRATASGCNDL